MRESSPVYDTRIETPLLGRAIELLAWRRTGADTKEQDSPAEDLEERCEFLLGHVGSKNRETSSRLS